MRSALCATFIVKIMEGAQLPLKWKMLFHANGYFPA
jgi:hypothetical protein